MSLIVSGMLGDSFRKGTNDQAYQRVLWQLREQQENNEKNNPSAQKGTETDSAIDFATAVIATEQAAAFQNELNIFHEASYQAIKDFDAAIDVLDAKIEGILDQAHVLDDGRRVFKTEDGLQVFDEFGNLLDDDVILPGEIPDHLEAWETYLGLTEKRDLLLEKRQDVVEFQSKLDEAQERLDRGDLTQKEFKDLRDSIYDTAPEAVRDLAAQRGLEFEASSDPAIPAPPVVSEIEINLDDELASLSKPTVDAPGLG